MSANTENFLPTPLHHTRHTTRRHLNVARAVILALAAACADNRTATLAGPAASAKREGIGRSATADFDPGVPLAYYQLSLRFSKLTGGFTPPVQARAFGYMGLALYESVVGGMPGH